ncbi:MAG: SH3 domain-containing protein [Clostridia bacterium]|nr:SH3 domain-containing protein [Clostridia bacterium]
MADMYSGNSNGYESEIKNQANIILNGIDEAKAEEKALIQQSGLRGTEDIKTLKAKALEGDVVAEYFLAMAMKVQGSAPGAGFDYNSIAILKNAADNGFGPAEAQYGLYLKNENNTDEALDYLAEGASKGDPDAIYALAAFYQNYAESQKNGSEEKIKYLKAAAIWYRVGLELGIDKICLRSYVYDSLLNSLNRGGKTAGGSKKSSKSSAKSSGGIAFNFDKRIIIVAVAILLLIIFLLVGIFVVWPFISNLLGFNRNSDDYDGPAPSQGTSLIVGDGDTEINLDDFEFNVSEDEDGYITGEIVAPETSQPEEDIPEDMPEEEPVKEYFITAQSGLHLRAEPSTEAESLVIMETGDIIIVEFIEDGWAKTRYGYLEGWCKADYIEPLIGDITPDVEPEDGYYIERYEIFDVYTTAQSGLWLREEPHMNGEKIILMPYGSHFTVEGLRGEGDDEWAYGQYYYCEYDENTGRDEYVMSYYGWCKFEYLKVELPD